MRKGGAFIPIDIDQPEQRPSPRATQKFIWNINLILW